MWYHMVPLGGNGLIKSSVKSPYPHLAALDFRSVKNLSKGSSADCILVLKKSVIKQAFLRLTICLEFITNNFQVEFGIIIIKGESIINL